MTLFKPKNTKLYDFVEGREYRLSRKGLGQEPVHIKSLLGDVVKENAGKSFSEKKNNIKNAIKNAPDKSFEPKDKLGDLSALAAHLTKSEVKMELQDYHLFVGRLSFDIVDSDNYSLYISSGVGFSYFGGNITLQTDGKSPDGAVAEVRTGKLKPDFYTTGLFGVGMGYKINDSMSLIAQYDFTFTSADLVYEKTEIISTVDGITAPSLISDEKEKIGKIDIYNHNFGVGLKIQF